MEFNTIQQQQATWQQHAHVKRVKDEIDTPLRLIVALTKTGNKVQINNEFAVHNDLQELEKFLFDRKTTIHTLSFFSNLNATCYNSLFTNSQEYNINVTSLLHNMQVLTNQISQETNPHIRNLLKINYDTIKEQVHQIKSYFKSNKVDTWVCRHMALAHILELFEVEVQKASIFFCSDEQKHLHKQLDIELKKVAYINHNIYMKLFAENLTIENLIASKNYLNSKNIFCLDDCLNNILSNIKNYSINTKLSDIGIQFLGIVSGLKPRESASDNAQIDRALWILDYFYKNLLPVCNHSFHTGMLKYDLSFHSINSFNQYLQKQCCRFYYKCPINYQEKYMLATKNHMMSFKITRKVDAVEISFFDINLGLREKVFRITHGEYHREINILNFINLQALVTYEILECDDYDLATLSCYRINNLDGNL